MYITFANWFHLNLSSVGQNIDNLFVMSLKMMFSFKQRFYFFVKDVTNCSPCLPLPGKSNQIFFLSSSSINLDHDLFVPSHLITEFRTCFG